VEEFLQLIVTAADRASATTCVSDVVAVYLTYAIIVCLARSWAK